MITFPSWFVPTLNVFTAVNIFVSVTSLIFVNYFRKEPIVAMGQPKMLSMLCLAALLTTAGSIFFVLPLNGRDFSIATISTFCSVNDWMWFIGNYMIFVVLLCKLYRVQKVMKFRRNQKILFWHLAGPFSALMALAIGIMIASQILYPYYPDGLVDLSYANDSGQQETVSVCWATAEGYLWFQFAKFVTQILIQVVLMVFAWKLRKLNEDIGDAKRILWFCVVTTIISIPSLIYVYGYRHFFENDGAMLYYFRTVLCFSVWKFVFVFSAIGFLIFPRIYFVCYKKIHGNYPEYVKVYGTGGAHVNKNTWTRTNTTKLTTNIDSGKFEAIEEEKEIEM